MAIEWEEVEPQPGIAEVAVVGVGGSGEEYRVWYGPAFLNPDTAVMRWIALGWPEPNTDNLPLFESRYEAIALCEQWEEMKIDAEKWARALFKGVRSGEG